MNRQDTNIRAALVDEYVLGTLQEPTRRRFEKMMTDDAKLRDAVVAARYRLDGLARLLPPSTPSDAVWEKVSREIDAMQATSPASFTAPATGDERGREAIDPASLVVNTVNALTQKLYFWRAAAVAGALCSAVLAFMLTQLDPPVTTTVVVVTEDESAEASWLLALKEQDPELIVRALRTRPDPTDGTYQLWMKPSDDAKVQPVGLISGTGETRITLTADARQVLEQSVLFGVSVEPPGGSPTGQPTTTPLFHGDPTDL